METSVRENSNRSSREKPTYERIRVVWIDGALGLLRLGQVSFGDEAPAGMVKLDYKMPKPMFVGTPKN